MHIWGLDLVYPAFVSPKIWYWVSYLEYMQCWQIKNYAIGEKWKIYNILMFYFFFYILVFLSYILEILGEFLAEICEMGLKKKLPSLFLLNIYYN